jgi:hypothetical protein
VSSSDNKVPTRGIITIYDTVISSEAGDKVFEPGIFYFEMFRGFFDGLFDTSVACKSLALTETTHIPNFVKNIFSSTM